MTRVCDDKLKKDTNRISHFSEQLAVRLEATNTAIEDQAKAGNNNTKANRVFLQHMNENINHLEVRTSKLEKQVHELKSVIATKYNIIQKLEAKQVDTENATEPKKKKLYTTSLQLKFHLDQDKKQNLETKHVCCMQQSQEKGTNHQSK